MVNKSKTRFVSPRAWERIEQCSRRKPVFALMGEFSAGKSTLINFLLRTHTLPTQVTATQLPPVWFSWGNRSAYVHRHDGSKQDIELNELDGIGVNDAQFIRIYLEADILEAVDLIDTPGISDPKISTDVWRRAVGQANGVLWCTHSTQAWRETERATWVSLPERLQHNSLLLVTRADALGAKDRQKVLRRVNREAGHLFNRSILFSARDAVTARDKTGDAELWARSGGGKMIDSFLEITEQIMDNRADMLVRYQIDKSLSTGAKVHPLRPSRRTPDALTTPSPADPDAAPLQLLNPVSDEGTTEDEAVENDVVAAFPVRPARVERRTEEVERPRIDADEAIRLRAEMTSEPEREEAVEEEATGDELRAFFRDTPSDPLDISTLSQAHTDIDDLDLEEIDDVDDEAENDVDAVIVVADDEQPDMPVKDDAIVEPDAEDEMLASLSSKLDEQLMEDTAADVSPVQETSEIEVSVSSITALLSKQAEDVDDYEPEPESNALVAAQVVSMPDTPSETAVETPTAHAETTGTDTALEDLLNVPAGSPLSAAAMWREIEASEDLPEDSQGLQDIFRAFLEEYDQIALEHSAKQARKEDLSAVPSANESSGAEWHVL